MTDDAQTVALELHRSPTSIEDALEETVRIKAFADLLGEHETAVRRVFADAADAHRAAGRKTAWSEKLKGVGQAYVTEPEAKGYVADAEAFAGWAKMHAAGRTQPRIKVRADVLEQLVNADGADHLIGFLEELSDRLLERVVLVEEGLADDVIAGAQLQGSEDLDQLEGKVVDPETGEVIPGLSWRRGKPTLTVKADPAAKRTIVEQLRAQLAPALEAGDVVDVEAQA